MDRSERLLTLLEKQISGQTVLAAELAKVWDPEKHPRESDGRFGSGDSIPVADAHTWDELETVMGMHISGSAHEAAFPERYEPNAKFGVHLKEGETRPVVATKEGSGEQPKLRDLRSTRWEDTTQEQRMDAGTNILPRKGSDGTSLAEIPVENSERLAPLFRVMSEEEWQGALRNGYIQSDGRMNLLNTEGTVASLRSTGTFYAVPGENRIVRIEQQPGDSWYLDVDGYAKTPDRVPLDRVSMISPVVDYAGDGRTPVLKDWDESKHPRQADGRFGSGSRAPHTEFIRRWAQAFKNAGGTVESLSRRSEADQAQRAKDLGFIDKARKVQPPGHPDQGLYFMRLALINENADVLVARTPDGHPAAAISFYRLEHGVQIEHLGSAGIMRGAATALQLALAQRVVRAGGEYITSIATQDSADYHAKIGRHLGESDEVGDIPSDWEKADLKQIVAEAVIKAWDADKHPRGPDGRFASAGSSGPEREVEQVNPGSIVAIGTGRLSPFAVSDYLVEAEAKTYAGRPLPEGFPMGTPQECYANATKLVIDSQMFGYGAKDLQYCEGLAFRSDDSSIGIMHGWAITPDGKVIDNTLPDPENWTYVGVTYPWPEYREFVTDTGYYGVLGGDWESAMAVMEQGWEEGRVW